MTAPISEHPPIYGQLVRELGDVVAETRKAAEQIESQARDVLDFSGVRPGGRARKERTFSAFG